MWVEIYFAFRLENFAGLKMKTQQKAIFLDLRARRSLSRVHINGTQKQALGNVTKILPERLKAVERLQVELCIWQNRNRSVQ